VNDAAINAIVVATRHHLHAKQVVGALKSGKHVFCEKPLCLNEEELRDIVRACEDERLVDKPLLMIGFNRRFAPLAVRLKSFLREIHEPLALHYRVNAGFIPADHWLHDPEQGGGRIIGEVCHFVDFLTFLAGAAPIEMQARIAASRDEIAQFHAQARKDRCGQEKVARLIVKIRQHGVAQKVERKPLVE